VGVRATRCAGEGGRGLRTERRVEGRVTEERLVVGGGGRRHGVFEKTWRWAGVGGEVGSR